MKTRLFLSLLGFACLLSTAKAQCDLSGKQDDVDFPDIIKNTADSYVLGVEYTITGAKQTDYYVEYYDVVEKTGRVDSHISGDNQRFIYRVDTWEAWTITDGKCELQNLTDTPEFFKSIETDWLHYTGSVRTTIGPSAMLKNAYDQWQKPARTRNMAYMGQASAPVRGEKAVFWRRCTDDNKYYVDYFFADSSEENPSDSDVFNLLSTPLRVAFIGVSEDTSEELSQQFYDIISFQRGIPSGVEPFQLPKGRNCARGPLATGPDVPDFASGSMLFNSEVVYRKYDIKKDELLSSYYSTFMFALDNEINHLAYFFSSWNTTKPDKEHKEPFADAPEFILYDTLHAYKYKVNFENAKCEISREKSFIPQYYLPENGGSIDLTDPYVLFPNNELQFLSEGTNRGLVVDIFEGELKDYPLGKDTLIPRALVSHSYLQYDEEVENTVSVRNAPVQMEIQLFRKDNIKEVLSFNIFGFTTRLSNKQSVFDVTRCFKNDDDYVLLTIGFKVEPSDITEVAKKISEIEENVLSVITLKSELNAVRIPNVMTIVKEGYVYVTLTVLGKPPLQLDFTDIEEGKSVVVSNDDEDSQGIADWDTCASNCLESRTDCWGFSLCGTSCYYGSGKSTKVEAKPGCSLFKRFSNNTFMPSKEQQVQNIINQINVNEFEIMVALDTGKRITLTASVADVTDPPKDASIFERMGNLLDPRMRTVKAGKKLKKGSAVKNLGKLRFEECQSLCLDYKNCETLSYCILNSECVISNTYASDLKEDDMVEDQMCNLVTRKFTDHFERIPGTFVAGKTGTKLDKTVLEDCARECLKRTDFKCLSFDHCATDDDKKGCTLYTDHYLNPKDRESVQGNNARCGHYTRKFSTEFKKKDDTRIVGSKIPPLINLTLEACAKTCIDYGEGTCFGYDFCQDKSLLSTSCILFDQDPSRMKSSYSDVCTNFARTEAQYAPHPFSNSYAGGIGFLVFLVGGIVGAVIVFVIAYIRVNRRS